ncbi:MAG TPA: glycosyltransferase [Candidatus Brocadiaceae bacterium]|nr:glycosyltransferase [Candidatus Brocadiaceae bacterium]
MQLTRIKYGVPRISDGVTIEKGSVIGAVVTNDIPPYSIAVGVPARVVKKRKGKELFVTEKLRIGVVVVTFNNAETVHSIIGALVSQTRMPDEIVVIDNASSDNTQDIIKGFQSVRYIRLTENTGSAGGFYEGMKIASENNDFVLTLDDDCDFKPDT